METILHALHGANAYTQVVLYVSIATGTVLAIPLRRLRIPLLVACVVIQLAAAVLRLYTLVPQ